MNIDGRSTAVVCFNFRWQLELGFRHGQDQGVALLCCFVGVESNTHIPVGLGGAIHAVEYRLQFYLKANGPQDVLELHLLFIAAVRSVGPGPHQFTLLGGLSPKLVVVKASFIGLSAGVVNVLHIDKDADFFQGG